MKKLLLVITVLLGLTSIKAQNPFAEYGYKPKIATLSQGKYNEFFDNDTVVQIGSVLYNTKSRQIIAFVEADTLYSEATLQPDIVSRWISPDPLADHPNQFDKSPYQYAWNNPIYWDDPDGRCPWCLVWAAVEVGLAVYDAYETGATIIDRNASTGEKWAAAGGFALGAIMPGGGYSKGAKETVKAVDDIMDAKKAVNSNAETFYRYVGDGEAAAIKKTGEIPNIDVKNRSKEIFITDRKYETAGKAKTHNQLPDKPTYRVEIDPKNVTNQTPFKRVDPNTNPQWGVGKGRESTTPNAIKVDPEKIIPLKK